jgi:ribosomal protein L37E
MHPPCHFCWQGVPRLRNIHKASLLRSDMAVKFTDTPCPRSKTERPCVLKHITSTAIGEGTVRQIWGCRRCGEKSYDNISVDKAECALSSSSKHQWVTTENLYFKQHQRYREIHDRQECLCCGAVRNYEYQSMIGRNPHRKNS